MKDVLQGVIRRIKADAAITAKVSTHVYRTIPTNPEHPFIACARIDGPPSPSESSETGTWGTSRIQCTTFTIPTSPGDADSFELSELIANCLSTQRDGGIQNDYLDPGSPKDLIFVSEIEDLGPIPDNSDAATTGEYRDNRDFIVHYQVE